MFENFDEDLFNLRIILETLENFEKFLENLINSFNLLDFNFNLPVLSKIYFYWSISNSEINIKCKSISRHSNGGAPPPVSPT